MKSYDISKIKQRLIARTNRRLIRFGIVKLTTFILLSKSSLGFSDSINGTAGVERTKVVSTTFKSSVRNTPQIAVAYSKEWGERWSLFAGYQINSINTLSASIFGLSYDSEDLRTKGGSIFNDGNAEIIKNPIWALRTSIGIGLFKYVDVLKSNNPELGQLNDVPVQADLYGIKINALILRFFDSNYAFTGSLSYLVASTSNFGISSNSASLGVVYINNR